jgi:hypothetical protein
MLIVADTHVHVYRDYDVAAALRHGFDNLTRLATDFCRGGEDGERGQGGEFAAADDPLPVLFLAETRDSHFFVDLHQGRLADRLPGWSMEPTSDNVAVWATSPAAGRFLVIAGRQLVTEERLEVLALATTTELPEHLGLDACIAAVTDAGAVPVLSWAPGKWSFQRGEVVAGVVESAEPGQLLVGDTSLRARATEPRRMSRARQLGLKVVAGSDPLPISGEESILGSYGVAWRGQVETDRPVDSLRRMLLDPGAHVTVVGKRSSWPGAISRLSRHTLASKIGRSNG